MSLQLLYFNYARTKKHPYKERWYYETFGMYRCHCGKEIRLKPNIAKIRKSCGCLTGGKTHGMTGRTIHNIWLGIRQRCYNSNHPSWHRYGGRGIKVCQAWRRSFERFYHWAIHHGWKPTLSIERTDNNKGYYPSNCRFIPRKRQARNRHTNKLTMKQVRKIRACYDAGLATNAQLARRYNITPTTMCKVVHRKIWKEGK